MRTKFFLAVGAALIGGALNVALGQTTQPMMKAVVMNEYGGAEVLKYQDAPQPEPKDDEILVRVIAAAVNPVDTYVRQGMFGKRALDNGLAILGYDIAGKAQVQELLHTMRLVVSVNLLGLPSVAVPVGVADGLPQGVQIIGSRYREDLCLDAAEAIERQVGVLTPIDLK